MWGAISIENRDLKGAVASSFLGGMIGLPWLFSYSYSLGYDLTLWIYNGWYIKGTLLNRVLPNWSYLSASGQPFFKMSGLSDGVLVALFMEVFGVFKGIQVFMWALYVLAAFGFYKMFFFLRPCIVSALTASGAYILSWFITFTANFQAYISNFFIYALLPFFVFCAFRLVKKFTIEVFLISAAILAVAILANPQVAIKMALIALLAIAPLVYRDRLPGVIGVTAGVIMLAVLLTMFDVVSALRLREEVITVNTRANAYISPFALISIPSYVLSLVIEVLIGVRWPEISLHELLYSKYPGTILVLLSVTALCLRDSLGLMVRYIWGIVLLSYGIFFLIMPHVPATPWVGISHNLLIIPTFFISLLAGFGMGALVKGQLMTLKNPQRSGFCLALLGLVELGGLLLGLRANACIGISPDKLPQISLWNEIKYQTEEDSVVRFFSFAPDHSKNLFPVITDLPTANVIELRQRSPEYQSYVDLIKRCSREVDCTQSISQLLAPLNVGYIDLPAKFYTYSGPVKEPNDYSYFARGLLKYDLDNQLQRVGERTVSVFDLRPKATSNIWSPWDTSPSLQSTNERLEQVLFKNYFRIPARVCDGAIAIIGTDLEPEKIFEQLAFLPQFEPGRYSFILAQSLSDIQEDVKSSLLGYTSAGPIGENSSITQLSMTDIKQLYEADTEIPPQIKISTFLQEGERLKIELEQPIQRDRFMFISQQFFRDWHAVDEKGYSVSLFKIGGGLTGAFLEKGTQKIELRYSMPLVERLGRWISFIAWLSVGSLLTVKCFTERKTNSKNCAF